MARLLKAFRIAVVVAVLVTGLAGVAQASQINGSQAINISNFSMDTDDINTATLLNLFVLNTTNSHTGDFALYPVSPLTNTTLHPGAIGGFTLGSADFGYFTVTSIIDVNVPGSHARTIYLLGNFTVGSNPLFVGLTAPDNVSVLMTFNQSGGAGESVSGSMTMHMPAAPFGVPEPTSLLLLGISLSGLSLAGLRRRK